MGWLKRWWGQLVVTGCAIDTSAAVLSGGHAPGWVVIVWAGNAVVWCWGAGLNRG
jgi:hypothetical protein